MNSSIILKEEEIIENDFWQDLRNFTDARIAIGHTGSSLPTKEYLNFSLAHAMARDAVHMPFEIDEIDKQLKDDGYDTIKVHSRAANRSEYLTRPDKGRRLDDESISKLTDCNKKYADVAFVIGDGLSSKAIHKHSIQLLKDVAPYLKQLNLNVAPIILAQQSRVALGDEIAELLKAKLVSILIGERPGLSSPDSLGVYITYNPYVGVLESDRNCISNIRLEGLSYEKAAFKLAWLIESAFTLQHTGTALKDQSDDPNHYLKLRPIYRIK